MEDSAVVKALKWLWAQRSKVSDVLLAPMGLRALAMAGLAVFLLASDWKAAKALGFGLGLAAAALVFLHWARKTLHPYLDLKVFAEKAAEDPVASALTLIGYFAFAGAFLGFLLFVVIR